MFVRKRQRQRKLYGKLFSIVLTTAALLLLVYRWRLRTIGDANHPFGYKNPVSVAIKRTPKESIRTSGAILPPPQRPIVLVHLGKTAGSTLTCMLGLGKSGKGDSRCESSDERPSALANSVTKRVHLEEAPIQQGQDILATLRNPIDRIVSWYYYLHPDFPPKKFDRHTKACTNYHKFFWCYDSIQTLSENGLAETAGSDHADSDHDDDDKETTTTTSSSIEEERSCQQLARNKVSGRSFCWHNTYNYDFTYGSLVRSLQTQEETKTLLYAIRTEHLEHDWKKIDVLLGGTGILRDPDAPGGHEAPVPRKNKWNKNNNNNNNNEKDDLLVEKLSLEGRNNLCRILCHEIQIYKEVLKLAINLDARDVTQSLDELLVTCPNESREVRDCPSEFHQRDRHLLLREQFRKHNLKIDRRTNNRRTDESTDTATSQAPIGIRTLVYLIIAIQFVAAALSVLIIFALSIPLFVQLKNGSYYQRSSSLTLRRGQQPPYSTYNLYLVYLAFVDLSYLLPNIAADFCTLTPNVCSPRFWSYRVAYTHPPPPDSIAGLEIENAVGYPNLIANLCLNAVIAYEVCLLLKATHRGQRITKLSLTRVNLQCGCVVFASVIYGIFVYYVVSNIEYWDFSDTYYVTWFVVHSSLTFPPFFYAIGVTIFVKCRGYMPSLNGSTTTARDRAIRGLAIYFFRIVIIFVLIWIPAGVLTVLTSQFQEFPEIQMYLVLAINLLYAIQPILTFWMILGKDDVKKYIKDFVTLSCLPGKCTCSRKDGTADEVGDVTILGFKFQNTDDGEANDANSDTYVSANDDADEQKADT